MIETIKSEVGFGKDNFGKPKQYNIRDSISLIIYSAFKPTALAGGLIASSVTKAIRYGVSRGLFTNEAGLGSTPITASIADSHPIKEQSLISMSATFWDTVVMCAITGIKRCKILMGQHVAKCATTR